MPCSIKSLDVANDVGSSVNRHIVGSGSHGVSKMSYSLKASRLSLGKQPCKSVGIGFRRSTLVLSLFDCEAEFCRFVTLYTPRIARLLQIQPGALASLVGLLPCDEARALSEERALHASHGLDHLPCIL